MLFMLCVFQEWLVEIAQFNLQLSQTPKKL